MPPNGQRSCAQCGQPLATDQPSEVCSACRSALFSLAAEDFEESPLPVYQNGAERWERLKSALPDRSYVRELGRGGMGWVLLLRHDRLERLEALKVLLPELADRPQFVERFLRESKLLAQLQHPNIVAVYDCSEREGILSIAMDYVDGGTLRDAIAENRLNPAQRIDAITQLASGLAYAHQNGVIHRDIKPANILLTQSGDVKVADFGLGVQDQGPDSEHFSTRPQEVLGTFAYMAPEQHQGRVGVDARSDVYALGVVCYELFTGKVPVGLLRPPSNHGELTPELEAVMLRALEQEPEDRYPDAQAFLNAWQKAAEHSEGRALATTDASVPQPTSQDERPRNPIFWRLGILIPVVLVALAILYNPFSSAPTSASPKDLETVLPKEFSVPDLDLALRWVPPGKTLIGAQHAEDTDASPPRSVELTYGFWMGVYEVTQHQYMGLMGSNPSYFNAARTARDESPDNPGDWRRRPVESVTWREAAAFCDRLTTESRRAGTIPENYRFRLPTEIEWEYVCRAGDTSVNVGHLRRAEVQATAWTREDFQDAEQSQPVGTKPPNPWGFYDMHGNVSEHCLNGWWYYSEVSYGAIQNWVPHSETGDRIFRGGSFAQDATRASAFKRSSNAVDERDSAQGFRIVLSEELPFVRAMLESELPNWYEVNALGLQMTWIPPGQFQMGEASPSTPRGTSVHPQTPTVMPNGFWMGTTEVTEFQWERVRQGDLSWLLKQAAAARDSARDLPIAKVSWLEATNFCHQLTQSLRQADQLPEGYLIRLPTEAEWEWACRRDYPTLYPFGDAPETLGIVLGDKLRSQENSLGQAGPVGIKDAGLSGLKGLYGNLREWCLDWRYEYSGTAQTNPVGRSRSGSTNEHSLRGGDFQTVQTLCTGTARSFADAETKSPTIGFRIILGRPLD